MVSAIRNVLLCFVVLVVHAQIAHGATSTCGTTTVGIPLKDVTIPERPATSDDLIIALGPPFFAKREFDKEAGVYVDIVIYVDGLFEGKIVRNASDPAIRSLSTHSCGVQIIYRFWDDGRFNFKLQALTTQDLIHLNAAQTGDTSWGKAP